MSRARSPLHSERRIFDELEETTTDYAGVEFLVAATSTLLPAARLLSSSASIAWTFTTAGAASAAVVFGTSATTACVGNDARLSDARTPTAHKTSHQDGGSDEIAVTGLSGLLGDAQTPLAHSTSHKNGGSDEVATATAAANAIPKAGAGGTLAIGFIPTGSTSSTVCIGNDSRLSDARTPTAHATTHRPGQSDAVFTADAGWSATNDSTVRSLDVSLLVADAASVQAVANFAITQMRAFLANKIPQA